MSLRAKDIEDLCHDRKTKEEALRLFGIARANTAVGSGFDLGENRTALPAVCAYLASQRLNNTDVTLEAAQTRACQNKAKFKKLLEQVEKALIGRKHASPTYKALLQDETTRIPTVAIGWMGKVQEALLEELEEADESTADEITCAVFIWVCNLVSRQRLFTVNSFEEKYDTRATNMRGLNKVIRTACGEMGSKILEVCDKAAAAAAAKSASSSASPRKSPTKPLRALPTGNSPQKRKASEGDADANDEPPSPSKKQKAKAPPPAGLVTLETIMRTRSMSSSPSKTPATPTKTSRRPPGTSSPTKSPTKRLIASASTSTPSPVKRARRLSDAEVIVPPPSESESDDDDDDLPPSTRRRFRPVFHDQLQWASKDPRLTGATMIERYGVPFPKLRRDVEGDGDAAMDSD
ncbi:hypothetical protein FB45DRAFT_895969 [Roridomyces roridus]|uniref:Origin recognition complex subunit 6 n=1 Tax=Roridomyces roridus TaxID=1738132 RepID=A0AAD7FXK0_9AGAR|nr:hypothetical protein FB45DRAFT_895969 [Roridomyces roridus]